MYKIDLHGMRHAAAEAALIRKIESMWGCGNALEIVTGNSDGMKSVVRKVLTEYELGWIEGDARNKGYIKTTIT